MAHGNCHYKHIDVTAFEHGEKQEIKKTDKTKMQI
jgi:hypothetical protein